MSASSIGRPASLENQSAVWGMAEAEPGFWRRYAQDFWGMVGLVVMVVITLSAIFAPVISPYDPVKPNFGAIRQAPNALHWLGTDAAGMDILSRLIYGGQVSISVAAVAVLISTTLGVVIGLVSGYYGGWIDVFLQRITEVFMSVPTLLLMIILAVVLGPSLINAMLVIGVFGWTTLSRLMRAQALAIKEREFIVAARAIGCRERWIIFVEILPNSLGPLIVNAVYSLRGAILAEASLSFLGVGVPPPTPSWGNMVTFATQIAYLESMPWAWIPPAIMLIVVIVAIGFVGDALARAFRR